LEAGLDARYNFTPSIFSHLTVNPDFATVEADLKQINLTRFELILPEKRNFFLEGNDIYKQRIQLFYSRRIADIYGGAKVYGKAASSEFGNRQAQYPNCFCLPLPASFWSYPTGLPDGKRPLRGEGRSRPHLVF